MEMCTWTGWLNDYFTEASEKKYKGVTLHRDVGVGKSWATLAKDLTLLESTKVVTVVNGEVGAGKSKFMDAFAAVLTSGYVPRSEPYNLRLISDILAEHLASLESINILAEHLASLESIIPAYFQSKPYNLRLISGVYDVDPRDNKGYSRVLKIEHSALQEFGNQWQLEVKCRPKGSKASSGRWTNIRNIYPEATVEVKQNYIELTLPTVEDSHEFAVFGTPEVKDKKRMRLGIFGGKATRGQDWNIVGTLFDDTMMAFESLCEKEERKGRQLLNILPGLFISNSSEDIKIDISGLEEGWKITGNSLMTIKSKDAWNSPENSTDFPCCVFEITHVDEAKQLFSCQIKASHLNDSAETELVAFFEQANEVMTRPELPIQENNVFDLFVFLQMLVFFVECLTGSSFDPQAPKKGSVADQVESFNSN